MLLKPYECFSEVLWGLAEESGPIPRSSEPCSFILPRGRCLSSRGPRCGQADADIELAMGPNPSPHTCPHHGNPPPPTPSVEREAGGIRALWLQPSPSLTVNNPRIEILSAQCFVSSISILLWCASWMPRYASRTAQSGSRLQKAIHPILMRLLSCSSIGTFVTSQFHLVPPPQSIQFI